MLPKIYVDARWNKILFLQLVSCGPISCLSWKILRTSQRNGCFYEKGSLGRDIPSIGMLVGLLLALTWQAASVLLGLASPPLTIWCGLRQWSHWAPYWLGAHARVPEDQSWSLQGRGPNSATSSTLRSLIFFLPLMIGVQQYAGLSLVVLGRFARGRTKLANLLPEGSCKTPQLVGVLVEPLVEDRLWICSVVEEQINVVCFVNENQWNLKTTKVYRMCANTYNPVCKNLVYFLGFQRFGIVLDFQFF